MTNKEYRELAESIAQQIKQKTNSVPKIAIILGSGLADIVECMENKIIIPYKELKGMLIPSVQGHKNQFIVGNVGEKKVIAMQGRFHPFNGFNAKECVLPIYIFKLLGVETCIVTNASGAINQTYNVGDIMLIKDHINNTSMNPLIGGPIIDYGVEFIDMNNLYDQKYREEFKEIANKLGINNIKEGVYMQVLGPNYETFAEIKFFRTAGADAVGMSTVLETIACRQCGIKVLGVSSITNSTSDSENSKIVLNHKEVLENASKVGIKLSKIIDEFIRKI